MNLLVTKGEKMSDLKNMKESSPLFTPAMMTKEKLARSGYVRW